MPTWFYRSHYIFHFTVGIDLLFFANNQSDQDKSNHKIEELKYEGFTHLKYFSTRNPLHSKPMRNVITIICLLYSLFSIAQEKKIEREVRIKEKAIPEQILRLLSPHSHRITKARYYKESNGEDYTFEAKVLVEGNQYSIEFSKSLTLEDIEKTIPFDAIPSAVRSVIDQELATFKKFKIEKTQVQFSSKEESPEQMIRWAFENKAPGLVQYEMVIIAIEKKRRTQWEMLFSREGKLIRKQEIDVRPHDFILY